MAYIKKVVSHREACLMRFKLVVVFFAVLLGVLAALMLQSGGKEAEQSAIETDAPTARPAVEEASQSVDDAPMDKAQTLAAYQKAVTDIDLTFKSHAMQAGMYTARIKQDLSFNNLDHYRDDASSLKKVGFDLQDTVNEMSIPDGVGDDDRAVFGDALDEADKVAVAYLSCLIDVAANADFGADTVVDLPKDSQDLERERKKLDRMVLAGYKHFGFSAKQIDMKTYSVRSKADG